jgi:hypothetical protein
MDGEDVSGSEDVPGTFEVPGTFLNYILRNTF